MHWPRLISWEFDWTELKEKYLPPSIVHESVVGDVCCVSWLSLRYVCSWCYQPVRAANYNRWCRQQFVWSHHQHNPPT